MEMSCSMHELPNKFKDIFDVQEGRIEIIYIYTFF